MMEINNNEVGFRIKSIRLSLGETTEAFSKHFTPPASKGTISKWENGKYLPNTERLKRIAELGNISVNELLYSDTSIKLEELKNVTYKNLNKEEIIDILDEYMKKVGE